MSKNALVEKSIPILRVRNLQVSLDYYRDILGFTVDWSSGTEDDGFAGISRDGHALYLSQAEQGHLGGWVWMGVTDARTFHAEYVASGARIRQEPTNYSWALEMQVEDPDGNVLRIGSEPE
jgi:catechol 2,3-dioxygenase-like lactoylglutathione lyase family enzyme